MQKPTDNYGHLSSRPQNFFKQAFTDHASAKNFKDFQSLLFTSACDLGVALNGGRRGAKHGPQSIINTLGKFQTYKDDLKILRHNLMETVESAALNEMQIQQAALIKETLSKTTWNKVVHLGGGHDQVYPLLKALTDDLPKQAKIICLNVDAHLDTRTDSQIHSGTPFRQWINDIEKSDDTLKSRIHFHQIGIHQQSNHPSNYQLPNMQVHEFSNQKDNVKIIADELNKIQINKDDIFVLSLDCDVFDAAEFPAVSAPNGNGLSIAQFWKLLNLVNAIECRKAFGIYEYNPVFDDLAVSSARKLAFQIEYFLG
jgi:formiminoglutamase